MLAYVGVTDFAWYELLARRRGLDEVNFWQPGGNRVFGALEPGGLFLFKLHAPHNAIVGGGFFAHATLLPVGLAWDAFREANGVESLAEMRERIGKYRRVEVEDRKNFTIGCILLEQPFFLNQSQWIPAPSDWARNIVQGKRYDLSIGEGALLFERLKFALGLAGGSEGWPDQWRESTAPRYGAPTTVLPRLGQGSFRVLVTDAYGRRCAATGERVLPVLEAAHIRPFSEGGEHRVDNGVLLRSDLHTLFDRGYLTVSDQARIEVSHRIREDFENGRNYYALHGSVLRLPEDPNLHPNDRFLRWHAENVYLG
ncbi:MAG: HNH endonuclease [Myxococcales bacterium]|nr:HNH endonuclease [Myxococcales bacterium]